MFWSDVMCETLCFYTLFDTYKDKLDKIIDVSFCNITELSEAEKEKWGDQAMKYNVIIKLTIQQKNAYYIYLPFYKRRTLHLEDLIAALVANAKAIYFTNDFDDFCEYFGYKKTEETSYYIYGYCQFQGELLKAALGLEVYIMFMESDM